MPIRTTPNARQVPINIVGSSTFGRYSKISLEKTYNMFITDDWLVNFMGYKKVLEVSPRGVSRGIFRSVRGGFALAVFNQSVYVIDVNLSPVFKGNLQTSYGDVYIDENLAGQICIVDGLNAYIYNYRTNQFAVTSLVTDMGSPVFTPTYVCFHNGFFLFGTNTPNSGGAWYAYIGGTGTTIHYNSTMAIQTKPDYAVAVERIPGQGNNVLAMGTTVCEIWTQSPSVNDAGEVTAYFRNSTVNIDYGCISASTIASSDQYIAWLGANQNNSPVIMVYTGNGAEPISTDGIDYVMEQIKFPTQSTAFFFRQDGHNFYQLTFYNDADNLTLVYDFTTKKFFNITDFQLNYHPATKSIYFNDKQYFTSLNDACLYQFSTDFTTYDDNLVSTGNSEYNEELNHEIPRIRICKSIRTEDSRRFIANSLVITMEQGTDPNLVGLDYDTIDYIVTENQQLIIYSEDGVTPMVKEGSSTIPYKPGFVNVAAPPAYQPRVDLSLSYDGGISFGNWVSRPLRPQGLIKNVITWEKMGAANDLTLKFRFSGTHRFIVNNGVMEIY